MTMDRLSEVVALARRVFAQLQGAPALPHPNPKFSTWSQGFDYLPADAPQHVFNLLSRKSWVIAGPGIEAPDSFTLDSFIAAVPLILENAGLKIFPQDAGRETALGKVSFGFTRSDKNISSFEISFAPHPQDDIAARIGRALGLEDAGLRYFCAEGMQRAAQERAEFAQMLADAGIDPQAEMRKLRDKLQGPPGPPPFLLN